MTAKAVSGSLLTVGAIILGLGVTIGFGAPAEEVKPFLPERPAYYIGVPAVVLGLAMIAAGGVLRLPRFVKRIGHNGRSKRVGKLDVELRHVPVDDDVLRKIHEIGDAVNADRFLDLASMRAHFAGYPSGFGCWELISEGRIVAFYFFTPLRQEITDQFLDGTVQTAARIGPGDVCGDVKRAAALYITELYGRGRPWNGYAIYQLQEHLAKVIASSRSLRYLLARPVTEEGKRVLERNKFAPIRGSEVWQYAIPPEDRL